MTESPPSSTLHPFLISLLSGGIAGTTVDVSLYPLDTIKTRLQSSQGFLRSGGFKGIYKGLSVAALGSAPGASLFFVTYDFLKTKLKTFIKHNDDLVHMTAASAGEIMACFIRVPTEVIKQRMQAGIHSSMMNAVSHTYMKEGIRGFYTGYKITILREIPFSLIQFPLYERFKNIIRKVSNREIHSYESALCGSVSGGIAAAITTPLDVIKTRMMLLNDSNGIAYNGLIDTVKRIGIEGNSTIAGNMKVFFAGVQPRVMWISIGGFFFFGAYEQAKSLLVKL